MESNEFYDEKTKLEIFGEKVEQLFIKNKLVDLLRRKVLLRKTLVFYSLLIPIIALICGGLFSPQRQTYTDDQLATKREFENDTGTVLLKSQEYSESNDIMVLNFETEDATSSIDKGINANNLDWTLYTPPGLDASKTEMDVIPLTGNKVSVVIKNLPKNYGALGIDIANTTASDTDVDVSLKNYDDYIKEHEENISVDGTESKTNDDKKKSNTVSFLISPQSGQIKNKKIKNLSREKFALTIFNEEMKFQKGQKDKLITATKRIKANIAEDNETIKQLERESQYLVGPELETKQDEIEDVRNDIDNKQKDVTTATENIVTVNSIITNLKKSIAKVKDGSYEFNAPIKSVRKDLSQE